MLSRLPFRWQLFIGAALGRLLYYALPSRREICHINLRLAFPELSDSRLKQLAKSVYRNIGYTVAEISSLWFDPIEKHAHRFELTGLNNLHLAQQQGHGVILLQAHFNTLEFCGAWLATKIKVSAVYDNPKNPLYAAFLKNRRQRNIEETIDNRDIRSMVKKLKAGGIVWYSPDQSVKKRDGGINTQFFDQPVLTTPGTSRMAKLTNAKILPYLAVRTKTPGKYQLKIFPMLDYLPGDDIVADTNNVNRLFESHIRDYPEQYFWVHKRFKRPSDDLPDPYQ